MPFDYARTLRSYSWCGVLARKYGMDLYANEAPLEGNEGTKHLERSMMLKSTSLKWKTKTFGDIDIESFGAVTMLQPLNSIAL